MGYFLTAFPCDIMLNNCDIIFVVGSKPPGVWGWGLLVVEDVVVVVVSPVLAVVVVPVESPEDTVVVGAAVVVAAVDPGMLGIPGMFILIKRRKASDQWRYIIVRPPDKSV